MLFRFDFIWFQFEFHISRSTRPRKEFFFLPEKIILDMFFSTLETSISFAQPSFEQYRIHQDDNDTWVQKVYQIVRQTPRPRSDRTRPIRSPGDDTLELTELVIPKPTSKSKSPWNQAIDYVNERGLNLPSLKGNKLLLYCHQQLFHEVMLLCAQRYMLVLLISSV